MPLHRRLFTLPLPVPTPRATPALTDPIDDQKQVLRDERAKLQVLVSYRDAIIVNQLVDAPGGLPHSMAEINTMIADQRAVIATAESDLVAMAGAQSLLLEFP